MTSRSTSLPSRTLSQSLLGPDGQPAVKLESLSVKKGQRITLTFESVGSRWRQGVFLATNGCLAVAEVSSAAFVFWSDSAPKPVVIDIVETDGRLVLYNIWDSGRGRSPFESQSETSGMLVKVFEDGTRRYSCTDIGVEPDFGRLVFKVLIE